MFFDIGSEQLGITRQETLQMAQTAYTIGDSHGTGAQRTYALLSGMGVFEAGCSKKEMIALKNDQVKDSDYKNLCPQDQERRVLTSQRLLIQKHLAIQWVIYNRLFKF